VGVLKQLLESNYDRQLIYYKIAAWLFYWLPEEQNTRDLLRILMRNVSLVT
jgi:hypothetical protein